METNGTTMEELRTMEAIQSINHKIPELTLRDLFAMHIITGTFSNLKLSGFAEDFSRSFAENFARNAYIYADAMLEARKEK
jgi:hypothetical protein